MDKKDLINYYKNAKRGEKYSQEVLLKRIDEITVPISLSYLTSVKKIGISFQDLRDLVVEAFMLVFNKFDADDIYDFDSVAKYYYIKAIQNEIRYVIKTKKDFDATSLGGEAYLYEGEVTLKQENVNDDEVRKNAMNNELFYKTVVENKAHLTTKEKECFRYYLSSYSINEIADNKNTHYQTIYKHINNAIRKIKTFVKMNYEDVFENYN